MFTNEIPGSRLTGGIFPGEFTFGAPMKDGASWRLKVIETTPAGLYTCLPEEASGNVGGNERATNIAGATEVVSISCSLTKLGWQEVERLRSEKKASDELLLDQGREAVKDILAKAKADAAVAPTAPLDSGLSAQTDAAINAGRAAADGAIAGGNMQVIEAMQSIAQRSMEQHALERQPISAASAASDAALGGRTESSSTSSSPSAYSGQSYSTNVDFHAHNPANEAAACIIAVDKYGYAANDIRDNNSGATFRNTCGFSVEVTWCSENAGGGDCNPGFSNIGTVLGNSQRGISYDASKPGKIYWAACRLGFQPTQSELSKTKQHACK